MRKTHKLLLFFLIGVLWQCKGKEGSMPFFLALGSGGASEVKDAAATANSVADSNGIVLPLATSSIQAGEAGAVPINVAVQEVPTKGDVTFTGNIIPMAQGLEANDVCGKQDAPSPPRCLDLTRIEVKIEVANGNSRTEVARTFASSSGDFVFQRNALPNNSYRFLINTGLGLNYAYEDVSFVFDPLKTPRNLVTVRSLKPEREYYNAGPAQVFGRVLTSGYNQDGVLITPGPLNGVLVEMRNSQNNLIASQPSDSEGRFQFQFTNLSNGNYTISYKGDSVTRMQRSFSNSSEFLHFTFEGNDPTVTTLVNLNDTTLQWIPASQGSLVVTGNFQSATSSSDSQTSYQVKLKNSVGAVLDSASLVGNSNFSLAVNGMASGVYTLEWSGSRVVSGTQSFYFSPDPTGGSKTISLTSPVLFVNSPTNALFSMVDPQGVVQRSGSLSFRPSPSQAPVYLLPLLEDENWNSYARTWILQALSDKAGKDCNLSANLTDPICSCALSPTRVCLQNITSTTWRYTTYSTKLLEVPIGGTVSSLSIPSGNWVYYQSVAGFEPFCGTQPTPCQDNPTSLVSQGNQVNLTAQFIPSIRRSQIAGTVAVQDGNQSYSNFSNLYVVLLGNTDSQGRPIAHITTTSNGGFSFGASSYVVVFPPSVSVEDRASYAASEVIAGRGTLASQSATVTSENNPNAPVDRRGDTLYFRQGNYQVVLYDRTNPNLSYLQPLELTANTASAAQNNYLNGASTNLSLQAVHTPRGSLQGSVLDAISTGSVSGAVVSLGYVNDSGNFVADLRRNCGPTSTSTTCVVNPNRVPGNDQLISNVSSPSNGAFAFSGLPYGSYTIRIESGGVTTYFPASVGAVSTPINASVITNPGIGNVAGSIRLPGGFSFTGSFRLEVVSPALDSIRPTAGVQPASLTSGATSFTNASTYSLFGINAGRWKVKFTSEGYKSVEGIVDVQSNSTTTFDIITFVLGSAPPATISGRTISALNNTNVCQLTARIRPGINVKSGDYATDENGNVIPAVISAADGSYSIPNVPAGNYTLEVQGEAGRDSACTGTGMVFPATYTTVVSAGTSTTGNQNIQASPILSTSNEMRIVLSWGANPRDLDSHLQFGLTAQDRVVWNNRNRLNGDAVLDVDVTSGFGPETITLKGTVWNQPVRYYSIYNWTGSPALGTSAATIRVFRGNLGEVRKYAVNPNLTGRWWEVFCLDPNLNITDVGTGSCNAASFLRRTSF